MKQLQTTSNIKTRYIQYNEARIADAKIKKLQAIQKKMKVLFENNDACAEVFCKELSVDNTENIEEYSDQLPAVYHKMIETNIATVDARHPGRKTVNKDKQMISEFYKNPTSKNFTKIWKRYYPGLWEYANNIMGDQTRAEDMLQETFQRAWEKRDAFDPEKSHYTTWIYTICRNFCLSALLNESRLKNVDLDISDVNDNIAYTEFLDKVIVDDNYFIIDSKTHQLERHSYDDIVEKMYDSSIKEISNMDPMFQRIITMKEIDNMSIADIADELSCSQSKVKNVYYKTREILANKITRRNKDLYCEFQTAMAEKSENTIDTVFKHLTASDKIEPDFEMYG